VNVRDAVLSSLSTALNVAVLKHAASSRFELVAKAPPWFEEFVPQATALGVTLDLASVFPFLDNFLIDAAMYWERHQTGHIASGIWVEVNSRKQEVPLEAFAVYEGGEHYLLIQLIEKCYRESIAVLQSARNTALTKEQLEREVRKRTSTIREREEEVAIRLLAATGLRDEETGAHLKRIGLYAYEMATALGWGHQKAYDMLIAAPMHDIGKIGIPDNILRKPDRLNAEEWEVMKKHTVIGSEMLACSDIAMINTAREIAESHHERWDGTGYPYGRKGDAIPEAARIVSVIDAYDALVHKRVYKPAYSEDYALQYLDAQSGSQFDPKMVALFFRLSPRMREIRSAVREGDFQIDLRVHRAIDSLDGGVARRADAPAQRHDG
jgi:HD-GYP domain-containing protein (c-di-GMP phosphodiesterase class II)